jgi:hypothetical protein
LELNGDSDITVNIRGAGTTAIDTYLGSIVDLNGCADIQSAVAVFYLNNDDHNCTQDSNDCYRVGGASCVIECAGGTATVASTTCTANFEYYANPSDDSTNNPYKDYEWESWMQIYDGSNYVSTSSDGVELGTNIALNVLEDAIDFGQGYNAGGNSGAENATSTIQNAGNAPIDTNISGTDMIGVPSGIITVNNIEWNINPFSYNSGTDLSGVPAFVDVVAPKATSSSGSEDEIYWGIGIPYGTDRSDFEGLNTFEVLLDSDDW